MVSNVAKLIVEASGVQQVTVLPFVRQIRTVSVACKSPDLMLFIGCSGLMLPSTVMSNALCTAKLACAGLPPAFPLHRTPVVFPHFCPPQFLSNKRHPSAFDRRCPSFLVSLLYLSCRPYRLPSIISINQTHRETLKQNDIVPPKPPVTLPILTTIIPNPLKPLSTSNYAVEFPLLWLSIRSINSADLLRTNDT